MIQDHQSRRHELPAHQIPGLSGLPVSEGDGRTKLLNDRQRREIAAIALRERIPRRTVVYRAHTPAESVFIVGDGVVKSFRDLPSGKRRVMAFLFAEDIFGLAESGLYINTAQTVTDAILFKIPLAVLTETLAKDAELILRFLYKVTHELRLTQRHTITIDRRDAVGRIAAFLRSLDERGLHKCGPGMIDIPMNRADIAAYLGLSPEAVSRACRRLEHNGIVSFPDRHRAHVIDAVRLQKLAMAY